MKRTGLPGQGVACCGQAAAGHINARNANTRHIRVMRIAPPKAIRLL
jgi:hypothetical protein